MVIGHILLPFHKPDRSITVMVNSRVYGSGARVGGYSRERGSRTLVAFDEVKERLRECAEDHGTE